jgi:hypothetical protein
MIIRGQGAESLKIRDDPKRLYRHASSLPKMTDYSYLGKKIDNAKESLLSRRNDTVHYERQFLVGL